jgi:hypothetical protein
MQSTYACAKCREGELRRVRRRIWERFFCAATYECRACHARQRYLRRLFDPPTVACRCPQCGTFDLLVLKRRDHIERYRPGLFRSLQRLLGARLYYCVFCRLQFHDIRKRSTVRPDKVTSCDGLRHNRKRSGRHRRPAGPMGTPPPPPPRIEFVSPIHPDESARPRPVC